MSYERWATLNQMWSVKFRSYWQKDILNISMLIIVLTVCSRRHSNEYDD